MTSQQFLVCDSSTLANFKQWASAISAFFTTAGWTQSSDTGQVNWSTIASVPGSAAFVYEIWEPGDALTAFYLKVEYGNVSGTNCPSLRVSIGTGTNGAGTLNGSVVGPFSTNNSTYTAQSTTTQYECNFSGDASRMCVMMWRNGVASGNNGPQQFFGIERSLDSSGSYTGTHVTLVIGGWAATFVSYFIQQSLLFGVGAAPISGVLARNTALKGGLIVRTSDAGQNLTSSFNGSIPFDTIAPNVGFLDYPLTMCGAATVVDLSEGVPFAVTLYGNTRTYMPSSVGVFVNAGPGQSTAMFCMRYD